MNFTADQINTIRADFTADEIDTMTADELYAAIAEHHSDRRRFEFAGATVSYDVSLDGEEIDDVRATGRDATEDDWNAAERHAGI